MADSRKLDERKLGETMGYDEQVAPEPVTLAGQPRLMSLEVVGGPMDGERSLVEGSVVTIGRDEDNDLCLGMDGTVSTRHARIVCERGHYWLEDLDSRNGTYLGDQRLRERTLIGPGTLFRVGRTRLEFSSR